MGVKYQLRMDLGGGNIDFAEVKGVWEWDSFTELIAVWSALMKYTKKRKARSYYITRAWGGEDSEDSDNDEDMEYEIIWDSKDDE